MQHNYSIFLEMVNHPCTKYDDKPNVIIYIFGWEGVHKFCPTIPTVSIGIFEMTWYIDHI